MPDAPEPSAPEPAPEHDLAPDRDPDLERRLDEVRAASSPEAWAKVEGLIGAVLDLHGAALDRILERLAKSDVAPELREAIVRDPLVAGLLVLHGRHPEDLPSRVARALDEARPRLGSHGGDVELVALAEDRVTLRLTGSCAGCPSSSRTARGVIEEALRVAAPELVEVEVEGVPGSPSDTAPSAADGSSCEVCRVPLEPRHGHAVDVERRRIVCICPVCLPGRAVGAGSSDRFRPVPERVLRLDDLHLDESLWDALDVPVRLAFFLRSAPLDRVVAIYPSPAGATESSLALGAWADLCRANPVLEELDTDVEALLVRGRRRASGFEGFLVPIDVAYELVGIVRRRWRGISGGPVVEREIEAFFAGLEARADRRGSTASG